MQERNPYRAGLEKNAANFSPLSPLSFLRRASDVYPDRVAVIYGEENKTWREVADRCTRLASGLCRLGVGYGDTVAAMLPNVPAMLEAHFGVPMAGAVLNAINIRLEPESVAFILAHSESKVLLLDPECAETVSKALALLSGPKPLVILVNDDTVNCESAWDLSYDELLGLPEQENWLRLPEDEWDAICLGYTSGTTGDPKGVVTHHRGAYLNALSNVLTWNMPSHAVYLWTLPMFHCNGWCFPWTLAAIGGTSVCIRRINVPQIIELIQRHTITHYCGAPIVHAMLADGAEAARFAFPHKVQGLIAGAAPTPDVFSRMEQIGVELTHVYGLTETYGPATVCAKQTDWEQLLEGERAECNARQGVRYPLQEAVAVLDPTTLEPVPWDGATMGEIMFRGNIVMKGYLKNPDATDKAFAGGWFHTGDLAVVDRYGYLKIRDRSKDIIISGGENISSLDIEEVLLRHPAVASAAVVAMKDPRWGEVPAAFVELRSGFNLTEAGVISHCRGHLAGFKVPKRIIFGPLTRTATGKVQKYALRNQLSTDEA